jgi:hypothetical protein
VRRSGQRSATLVQPRAVTEENIPCACSAMTADLFSLAERQPLARSLLWAYT